MNDPQKKHPSERPVKYCTGGLKPVSWRQPLALSSDVDQDT